MKNKKLLKKKIVSDFNNLSPCKNCLIQACCSEFCNEFKDFYENATTFVANELDGKGLTPIEFTKLYADILFEIIGADQDTFRKYNQCKKEFKK